METDSNGAAEPLGRSLVFTAKAVREAFEATLAEAGGSLGTWVVLSALSDVGIVSQAALASHVHLEGATITHHIDRLEAQGLVRRQSDPDDRRVRRLELTASGAELHNRLFAAVKELERTMTGGVEAEERRAFQRVLERVSANLAARGASAPEALPQDAPAG
jgi:MarR family transcriptional regulator, transcriptional regulator for hemolysin